MPRMPKHAPRGEACAVCGTRHAMRSADHPDPTSVLPRGTAVFRFGSGSRRGSPAQVLSNFWGCHVSLDHAEVRRCAEILLADFGDEPRVYPSSEHAYVYFTVKQNPELYAGGAMASLEGLAPYAGMVRNKRPLADQARTWGPCIGIAAKLYGNIARLEAPRTLTMEQKRAVWMVILHAKYRDPHARAALLSTGDAYLLEFARGAVNRQRNGQSAERWGGWHFEDKVWGENHMGELLMAVRAEISNS